MANPPRPTITILPGVPNNIVGHLDSAGLPRVYGILVASDDGVTVRISDTFRMDLQFHPGSLDRSVLDNEINRCKTFFTEMVIVGWYSTVDYADEHDMLWTLLTSEENYERGVQGSFRKHQIGEEG